MRCEDKWLYRQESDAGRVGEGEAVKSFKEKKRDYDWRSQDKGNNVHAFCKEMKK